MIDLPAGLDWVVDKDFVSDPRNIEVFFSNLICGNYRETGKGASHFCRSYGDTCQERRLDWGQQICSRRVEFDEAIHRDARPLPVRRQFRIHGMMSSFLGNEFPCQRCLTFYRFHLLLQWRTRNIHEFLVYVWCRNPADHRVDVDMGKWCWQTCEVLLAGSDLEDTHEYCAHVWGKVTGHPCAT